MDAYTLLRNLLVQSSGLTGTAFLGAAVRGFASQFGAKFVFIARALDPNVPARRVRVLAAWRGGAPLDGWEFDLPGTPCEAIYAIPARYEFGAGPMPGTAFIASEVSKRFEPARGSGLESFIGIPLWSADQRMIGHLALFFDEPIVDVTRQEKLVEIICLYAQRVEAELNRIILDESREALLVELAAIRQRLELDSITDPLTGLFNRRHWDAHLRGAFARLRRSRRRFGVLMLDLDHFKQINDSYGHDAGDRVLRAVAGALREAVRRDIEYVHRIGGEEFVILCDELATHVELQAVAERINRQVRSLVLHEGGRHLPVTISIGATLACAGDRDPAAIQLRADRALYQAKAAGRDRAVIA